jgi:hypothetical protein
MEGITTWESVDGTLTLATPNVYYLSGKPYFDNSFKLNGIYKFPTIRLWYRLVGI